MAERPRCPGQDLRFWKPGDIFDVACPACGGEIEFWKDEPARPCPKCGREVRNPKIDLGCAKWCKHVKECLGMMPDEVTAAPLVERLAAAIEKIYGPEALGRSRPALELAREIMAAEGGSPLVIQAAVLLSDVADHGKGRHCKPLNPGEPCDVKQIMDRAGIEPAAVERVCHVLWAIHTGLEGEGPEFAVVWDASQLLTLRETPPAERAGVASIFRTAKGAAIAEELMRKRTG